MHNNLGKTLTYSDLTTDFSMGGPDEGDGIISLGAMIDGGTNFKVMYNALKRLDVNVFTSCSTYDAEIGDPMFSYDDTVRYILAGNSRENVLDHNIINGSQGIGSILTAAPLSNSARGTTPVLTPLFCYKLYHTKRWESEDAIYYFIPSTNSNSGAWIGLGVKSNCWSHDDSSKKRWIIGKRIQLNRSSNYIFKVDKNAGVLKPGYSWSYYAYNSAGTKISGPTVVPMNGFVYDDYMALNVPGGDQLIATMPVTSDSVHNRLSGNFFDILKGLNDWGWGVTESNRRCTCFYCPIRGTNGTYNSGITSMNGNLHAAPHKYLGNTTQLAWWSGANRPFGKYRHIAYLDLNYVQRTLSQDFQSLILYPGVIVNKNAGSSSAYLRPGAILDLHSTLGSSSSAVTTINNYNQYIMGQQAPSSSDGGKIMYIIPHFDLSVITTVYISTPNNISTNTTSWSSPAGGDQSKFLSSLGVLLTGHAHIIECWVARSSATYAKMYTYDEDGQCIEVSDTISCQYS